MPVEIVPKQAKIGDWDVDMETERNRFSSSFSNPVFKQNILPENPRRLVKVGNNEGEKVTTENQSIPSGAFVKHGIFGIGKVIETSMVNGNEKAEIDFGEKGVKSLLLKFAKLEVLK